MAGCYLNDRPDAPECASVSAKVHNKANRGCLRVIRLGQRLANAAMDRLCRYLGFDRLGRSEVMTINILHRVLGLVLFAFILAYLGNHIALSWEVAQHLDAQKVLRMVYRRHVKTRKNKQYQWLKVLEVQHPKHRRCCRFRE